MFDFKKFIIVSGHYGCGKTNFSINLALKLREKGKDVILVDFDIVNPYFRSSDYVNLLERHNVKLISPIYANTTLDLPSIDAQVYSVFLNRDSYVIFDVGGDDAGAKLLARFSDDIRSLSEYDFLFLVNKYRPIIDTSDKAFEILKEIEVTSKLKVTAIVNNSNIQHFTTETDILGSVEYSNELSKKSQIPVIMTTCSLENHSNLSNKIENIFNIDIYVKPPW